MGLISRQPGQPGHRQLTEGMTYIGLAIIRDRYLDFGPTLACEKLRERQGIVLAKETVLKFMTKAELCIPRKQRPPSIYQPRNQRSCVGELIQIDGSDYRWFTHKSVNMSTLWDLSGSRGGHRLHENRWQTT